MRDWTLDELAVSFLESGFWIQEAVLVVEEVLYGEKGLVVVEGNRRIAALMYLKDAIEGKPASRKWAAIAEAKEPPPDLFEKIPYIKADSRKDIEAFLGFRHVTGIKEWNPAEKAEAFAMPYALSEREFRQSCNRVNGLLLDRYRLLSAGGDDPNWVSRELQERIVAWLAPRLVRLPHADQ